MTVNLATTSTLAEDLDPLERPAYERLAAALAR